MLGPTVVATGTLEIVQVPQLVVYLQMKNKTNNKMRTVYKFTLLLIRVSMWDGLVAIRSIRLTSKVQIDGVT